MNALNLYIKIHRDLPFSNFTSNFKTIRKPETYKCSDKRCKICQNYLNETNKFWGVVKLIFFLTSGTQNIWCVADCIYCRV